MACGVLIKHGILKRNRPFVLNVCVKEGESEWRAGNIIENIKEKQALKGLARGDGDDYMIGLNVPDGL